ncbi:MAG: winged helix-turn-helix domain-containing tetratricopeptide repeat protein [Hyphomicrobium sp.]
MLRFSDKTLDLARGCLTSGDKDIALRPKSFAVMRFFVENAGRLISKDALIAAVWPQTTVTDESLTQCISEVRKAIGDCEQAIIKTVPRRGYVFTAQVSRIAVHAPVGSEAIAAATLASILDQNLSLPDRPSIAVLPFTNMSREPDQEFFGDGIAEDILTALSKLRWLIVIARNSSFTFRGKTIDVRQISRELGVRYVLEGSVRRAERRVRVTCQLIDATSASHLWAERYDRDLADIFAVQDEITQAVAGALGPAIEDAERRRAVRKPPESLGAWEACQRGLWHLSMVNSADNFTAERFFRQAIDLDPTFAAAYDGLGGTITARGVAFHTMTLGEAADIGEAFSRKALSLDDQSAHARARIALSVYMRGDLEDAIQLCREALVIDPNCDRAHGNMGAALMYLGRRKEARTSLIISLRLSPKDPAYTARLNWIAISYYLDGEYTTACDIFKQVFRKSPSYIQLYRWYIACLGQLGRAAEAATAISVAPPEYDQFALHRPPFICAAAHEHMLDGMRKAGWRG